jgi:hypothetical protein
VAHGTRPSGLFDLETESEAFMILRATESGVAVGIGIRADGDLDFSVSLEDARRLGEALLQAGNESSD